MFDFIAFFQIEILNKLRDNGQNLTDEDKIFLEKQTNQEILQKLENITPE